MTRTPVDMDTAPDVLVFGSNMAGLSTAAALAHAGVEVPGVSNLFLASASAESPAKWASAEIEVGLRCAEMASAL